jgi:thymidylate kinase
MKKSKIIIVEGAQGVGKTTITDYIRNIVPYTNLYRLNGTSDASKEGKSKSFKMYVNLINYIKNMEGMDINLLFDRTFFTEEVYCRLGFKDYKFTDIYEELLKQLVSLNFDIYYITLYLSDTNMFSERLNRVGKAKTEYAMFDVQSSIKQQIEYLKIADEVSNRYPSIHTFKIDNSKNMDNIFKEIKDILSEE